MRLLGLDNSSFDNHLIQIKTGEGKSITLGVAATFLALNGYNVSCICYSKYLSDRDFNSFESIFKMCGVVQYISYGTINMLCEKQINANGNVRELTSTFVADDMNKLVDAHINRRQTSRKNILLIDEADVFFSDQFYGKVYRPITQISNAETTFILMYIYRNRAKPESLKLRKIRELPEYKTLVAKYPSWEVLIDFEVLKMLSDVTDFANPVYIVESDKIKYKDCYSLSSTKKHGYKTSFAYVHESLNGKISEESRDENLGINLQCGNFSYAEIPYTFDKILGVTGTLQCLTNSEKLIMQNYNINRASFMPSMFGKSNFTWAKNSELNIFKTTAEYFQAVSEQITACVNQNRAILIFFDDKAKLFEYAKQATVLTSLILPHQILTEETEFKDEIILNATAKQQVTLLTSSFGRGVDFSCYDPEVLQNGGVHVVQTYLSKTKSEELQTQGRTARQANKGSYSLILLRLDLEAFGITEDIYTNDLEGNSGTAIYQKLHAKREAIHAADVENMIQDALNAKAEHKTTLELVQLLTTFELSKKDEVAKKIFTINDADGSLSKTRFYFPYYNGP